LQEIINTQNVPAGNIGRLFGKRDRRLNGHIEMNFIQVFQGYPGPSRGVQSDKGVYLTNRLYPVPKLRRHRGLPLILYMKTWCGALLSTGKY
jgi:hypothetical protein